VRCIGKTNYQLSYGRERKQEISTRNWMGEEDLETEQGLFLPVRMKKRGESGESFRNQQVAAR
jgi:hypothetical protein